MKYIIAGLVLTMIVIMAFNQPVNFIVTGTTTAEDGSVLSGVSINVKGSTGVEGIASDATGKFAIQLAKSSTLLFAKEGYQTQKMYVRNSGAVLKIVMKLAVSADSAVEDKMDEVVVVGYAAAKRKDLAGSVSIVDKSTVEYESAPVSYGKAMVQQPLAGRVPGINIRNGDVKNVPLSREGYDEMKENEFRSTNQEPLSTFSIDVDAASYSNVRRILNDGQLPPAGAVRIEEMINYFKYKYDQPVKDDPFSINTEISACPWNPQHQLVSVGLQGKLISTDNLPASNLVFLIDVSGSMSDPNKLPLVQRSLKLLTDQLREKDKVALVVYAGSAGVVLPSTGGDEKIKIKDAIDRLEAGGSTAGGEGIQLAYKIARENFVKSGNNRIILCSDGDFNVGPSSDDELVRMIEKERQNGVFLTILGYGMGNYQDAKMQKLADKGNGNHAYIDNFNEARKVLVKEFGGTLFAIAKDVKLQVEFNPAKVQAYRLVGYENRVLANEDFNDDKKDAGDLGSGHTVTALYELIPVGVKSDFIKTVDPLKYQKNNTPVVAKNSTEEYMTIKFRYKKPDGDVSKLISHVVVPGNAATSENFRFAAAVAQFGMLLRNSEFKQQATYENTLKLAKSAIGEDEEGYRSEFVRLVSGAREIDKGMGNR
ncbi:MAG: von Willebrand factor type A domain-containing protein [Flavitalea sp.]